VCTVFSQVPFYWAAQFTGAMCAAFVLKAVLYPINVIGTTTPTGPHWHRDRRHLQHDVRYLRRRDGLQSGTYASLLAS
jgi:hypothetical protein